ncbi:MAG: sugar ABC transporter permease [Clostridia bacterium]|nr:sugar ABC transporter permease [Clostridia bacterium]
MKRALAETVNQSSLKKPGLWPRLRDQWDLQLLGLPGIILILIFSYLPMYGLIMSFQEYRMGDFPGMSQWVGLKQFQYLLKDPSLFTAVRNTLVISVLKLTIGFVCPIIFAVFLNEIHRPQVKKTVQTVSYLPHFISWTVCAMLMMDFLSVDNGAFNEFLVKAHIVDAPIPFFQNSKYFWGMALFTDIWKELGWNSIIYISAMAGVDAEMYEAADIDGATRVQKIWYITVKAIKPTIILLFIMSVGGILNTNFDQIMMLTKNMGNAMLKETADVIDTYIYRYGLGQFRVSFATAAGLVKAVINFALLLGANKIADVAGENALF